MSTMNLLHYRDLITRAVDEGGSALDKLAAHMDDAARAKQLLQLKGYGGPWDSMAKLAAQVPEVARANHG
jgi:hypothetical protein